MSFADDYDESLPARPRDSRYDVQRVSDGLQVDYQKSWLVLGGVALWMVAFMAVVAMVATFYPSSTSRLLKCLMVLAAPVPFVVLLGARNFMRGLTLMDNGEVRLGSSCCPAAQVKRSGWRVDVADTFIFLPFFRQDLDWLCQTFSALAQRTDASPPLGLPPIAALDPTESRSDGMLFVSLATLLGGFGWTAYLASTSGMPSIPGLSPIFAGWLAFAIGVMMVSLTGRNTITLSTFLLGLMCFAWGANFHFDSQVVEQDFPVLASFSTGHDRPGGYTDFLELDVPPQLESFRFVVANGAPPAKVTLRHGPGVLGQPWVRYFEELGTHNGHFKNLGDVPMGQDSLEEVFQRKGTMIIEGQFQPGSRAHAQFQAWGANIRPPKPKKADSRG